MVQHAHPREGELVGGELASALAVLEGEEALLGGDPELVAADADGVEALGGAQFQATGHAAAEAVAAQAERIGVGGGEPEGAVLGGEHVLHVEEVHLQIVGRLEPGDAGAVVAGHAARDVDPQVTVGRLGDAADPGAGQPVAHLPDVDGALGQGLARVERGGRARDGPRDHEERREGLEKTHEPQAFAPGHFTRPAGLRDRADGARTWPRGVRRGRFGRPPGGRGLRWNVDRGGVSARVDAPGLGAEGTAHRGRGAKSVFPRRGHGARAGALR